MLDSELTFDYDGSSLTVKRINQDNYSSEYFGEVGTQKIKLTINHTIPGRGGAGESHLVRFDVEHYDATGIFVRQSSAWTVIKTFDSVQDTAASTAAYDGLAAFMATSGVVGSVLNRES